MYNLQLIWVCAGTFLQMHVGIQGLAACQLHVETVNAFNLYFPYAKYIPAFTERAARGWTTGAMVLRSGC
jgi:hypothetical protein